MSEIYLYIFYGLTCLTIFTCSTIIVLGIFECILLRKKRLSATIIPSKEKKRTTRNRTRNKTTRNRKRT